MATGSGKTLTALTLASKVAEDAGLLMEDTSRQAPFGVQAQRKLDLKQSAGRQPSKRIQPILNERVFNVRQVSRGNGPKRVCWVVFGSQQNLHIIRLQMGRDDQLHLSAPRGKAGHASSGQGKTKTCEVARSSAVERGCFETRDKKVTHEVVSPRAIGEPKVKLGQRLHERNAPGSRRLGDGKSGALSE